MSKSVSKMLDSLKPDSWRAEVGFSPEVDAANRLLFRPNSDAEIKNILNTWLQKYQPCLFGRIAAKLGLISYCIITDSDLDGSEEDIARKIEGEHELWRREGFEGKKSGFVLVAVSERIALAEPNEAALKLARKLCSHLLLQDIETDSVYLDNLQLELPTAARQAWQWDVGVNYFCSHGDRRWWNDHRIPGGMGFSLNSVGHMAKSGQLARAMKHFEDVMDVRSDEWQTTKVESLEDALKLAMQTIQMASHTVSGKATELLPLPSDLSKLAVTKCPVALPRTLKEKNFCEYLGYYHTDYTLPSEYFLPHVERPEGLKVHGLDFTYLFNQDIENPDFVRMGQGRRIRADVIDDSRGSLSVARGYKRSKAQGRLVNLGDEKLPPNA